MRRVINTVLTFFSLFLLINGNSGFSQTWGGVGNIRFGDLWSVNVNGGVTSYFGDISIYDTDLSCNDIDIEAVYSPKLIQTDSYLDSKHTQIKYKEYDNYGNFKKVEYYGDLDTNEDDKTIFYGYYPNTDKWIIHKPAWQNIFEGIVSTSKYDKNLAFQTLYYYDYQENEKDFTKKPIKGELTKVGTGLASGYSPNFNLDYNYVKYGDEKPFISLQIGGGAGFDCKLAGKEWLSEGTISDTINAYEIVECE